MKLVLAERVWYLDALMLSFKTVCLQLNSKKYKPTTFLGQITLKKYNHQKITGNSFLKFNILIIKQDFFITS
jgi:hypothetical protein